MQAGLARLGEEMYSLQAAEVRGRIRLLVPEYVPYSGEDSAERLTLNSRSVSQSERELLPTLSAVIPGTISARLAGA